MAKAFGDQPPTADQRIALHERGIVPDKTVAQRRPVHEKRRRDDDQNGAETLEIFQGSDDAKHGMDQQGRDVLRPARQCARGGARRREATRRQHRAELGCDARPAAVFRAHGRGWQPVDGRVAGALRQERPGVGSRRPRRKRAWHCTKSSATDAHRPACFASERSTPTIARCPPGRTIRFTR